MLPLSINEIKDAVSGKLLQGNGSDKIEEISIDSRTLASGSLFIAIIGEKFDGHSFVKDAVKKGAEAVIVDRPQELPSDISVIMVDDTTTALQDVAHYYRKKFKNLDVIGITGSTGKTTTKDIMAGVLAQKYNILKTGGNLNNDYGLPLSLLKLTGEEEIAVLEMGMSALGEIKKLAKIAEPQIGVITNVGPTHLQNLKTTANVARGKRELIENLPEGGTAVLNYDNKYVRKMKNNFRGRKVIYYGFNKKADIFAFDIKFINNNRSLSFKIKYEDDIIKFRLNKPGQHNIYNALPAIVIGRQYNLSWKQIRDGLINPELSSLRMDIKTINGCTIINDTYNANPLSMKAGINVLKDIADGRKIAVLGAMLELGPKAKKAHLEIANYLVKKGIDILITVGKWGQVMGQAAVKEGMNSEHVYYTENNGQAAELLQHIINPGDTVLVKGSRGVKMEEIVTVIVGQEEIQDD